MLGYVDLNRLQDGHHPVHGWDRQSINCRQSALVCDCASVRLYGFTSARRWTTFRMLSTGSRVVLLT